MNTELREYNITPPAISTAGVYLFTTDNGVHYEVRFGRRQDNILHATIVFGVTNEEYESRQERYDKQLKDILGDVSIAIVPKRLLGHIGPKTSQKVYSGPDSMSTVDLHQPAIPISYALQLLDLCARWHVAPAELMADTALSRLSLTSTEERLSPLEFNILVGRAIRLTGEPALGYHFGHLDEGLADLVRLHRPCVLAA